MIGSTGRRACAARNVESGFGSCVADAFSGGGGSAVALPKSNATDRSINKERKTGSGVAIVIPGLMGIGYIGLDLPNRWQQSPASHRRF